MRVWALVLACSGCSSILGIDNFKLGDAGNGGEQIADGSFDAPPGCLGPQGFVICLQTEPTSAITFDATNSTINTTTNSCAPMQPASWIAAQQPDACFIIATRIVITSTLRVTGARPLVLVATDEIVVNANTGIDAAAHRQQMTRAPAAPFSMCGQGVPAMDNPNGAGGGAGGTFIALGGRGGGGNNGQNQGGMPPNPLLAPTKLHAGCDGQIGGTANGTQLINGGGGGGAVYLAARNRITINSAINVSGAAGLAGDTSSGGGGGGAGGMILLHAPSITGSGPLMANGGGGAGGSALAIGTAGTDPDPQNPTQPAQGGGGAGAPGGQGSVNGMMGANGGNGQFQGGGGGGGGGGGYIRANVTLPPALLSTPPATIVP
jgi:hypothetical protein